MDTIKGIQQILIHRKRSDLASLLNRAWIQFDVSSTYGSYLFSKLASAEIYAPVEDYEHLRLLTEKDKELIFQALHEIHPPREHDMEITRLEFRIEFDASSEYSVTNDQLLTEIEAQRNLMISVATGGPRINTVNDEYKERRDRIEAALQERSLTDPSPYTDLWGWYGKWSSGDLPTYQSRRKYISELYAPLIERIKKGPSLRGTEIFEGPVGWAKVDRGLGEIRKRLEEATTEEQFQAVGLLCRETLISLAQIVYDPSWHSTADGVVPSDTDAKRMLDTYLSVELVGGTNEAARRHAKAALSLANDLQHRRTATFRQAALCAEATVSVANLVAIISGQRDP